jgi:hypothetical protein
LFELVKSFAHFYLFSLERLVVTKQSICQRTVFVKRKRLAMRPVASQFYADGSYAIVDLPGSYKLDALGPAERGAASYLRSKEVDVVVNLVDASRLAPGLELTLELLPLKNPFIVRRFCSNEGSQFDDINLFMGHFHIQPRDADPRSISGLYR